MTQGRVLRTSVTVSVVLHAALFGALVFTTRSLVPPERPLRVRIIETPTSPSAVPAPPVPTAPLPRSLPPARSVPPSKVPEERVERRDRNRVVPDVPAVEPGTDVARKPPPPAPAVQSPAQPPLPLEAKREPMPERAREPEPSSKSGLSLGGSDWRGTTTPAPPRQPGSVRQKSLREQLDEIGSRMTAETGKHTISLDSRDPDFQGYLARLKRRVERVWTYPEPAIEQRLGGELLLVFTLNKAGSLVDLRLLQSSGFPILDEEALRAIRAAAPYDPFPPELGEEPWNILATFRYNMSRYYRR